MLAIRAVYRIRCGAPAATIESHDPRPCLHEAVLRSSTLRRVQVRIEDAIATYGVSTVLWQITSNRDASPSRTLSLWTI